MLFAFFLACSKVQSLAPGSLVSLRVFAITLSLSLSWTLSCSAFSQDAIVLTLLPIYSRFLDVVKYVTCRVQHSASTNLKWCQQPKQSFFDVSIADIVSSSMHVRDDSKTKKIRGKWNLEFQREVSHFESEDIDTYGQTRKWCCLVASCLWTPYQQLLLAALVGQEARQTW